MQIKIISAGLLTTLQDSGRKSFLDVGVPTAGFMDAQAAQLANALLNKDYNEPLLEMVSVGITCTFSEATTIAITGANMHPKLNGKNVAMNKAIYIPKNATLSFSGASNGVYSYLAIAGDFSTTKTLGSNATYLPASLGGFNGCKLQKGDLLVVENNGVISSNAKVKTSNYPKNILLPCLKGPEWKEFSKQAQEQFLKTPYVVSNNSNRIGIRLEGKALPMPIKDEIISSGIVKGTVQITKAGIPIVMMADAPTTGGYLRMVNLTEAAIHQLAQVPILGKVTFTLMKIY